MASKKRRGGRKKSSHRKKSTHRKKATHRKKPRGKKRSSHKKKATHRKKPRAAKKKKGGRKRKGGRKGKQHRNMMGHMTAAGAHSLAMDAVKRAAKAREAKLEKAVKSCGRKLKSLEDKIEDLEKRKPRTSAAKKGKKKGSKKRARPGTKGKACKPFSGKRKKPVKCRPKPSAGSLAGCGTAAARYGEDKRELCGPGTPRKPGKALAEERWAKSSKKGGKKRNASVHSTEFWGN